MKTLKQIAQEAAQEVLDQNWVEIDEDIADSEPVSILAWEMGEGIGYETALREIVEREDEFSDYRKQKIEEIYWEDYYGYHEAGYIEDEKFQGVVDDVLSGNIQEHQETKLW